MSFITAIRAFSRRAPPLSDATKPVASTPANFHARCPGPVEAALRAAAPHALYSTPIRDS